MSATVFIIVAWVFLSRFDKDYYPFREGIIPAVLMLIATILAIIWDLKVLSS